MDSKEIDNRIKHYEGQLSESMDCDDKDKIECQMLNLRFLKRLKILQQKANKMKEEPTTMEILNKLFPIRF